MNEKIKNYLDKNRSNDLIKRNLCTEEYAPDTAQAGDYALTDEYPYYDDSKNKYYKKTPFEITDEDYEKIKKTCFGNENEILQTQYQKTIKNILTYFAVLATISIICGFVMAFQLLNR